MYFIFYISDFTTNTPKDDNTSAHDISSQIFNSYFSYNLTVCSISSMKSHDKTLPTTAWRLLIKIFSKQPNTEHGRENK